MMCRGPEGVKSKNKEEEIKWKKEDTVGQKKTADEIGQCELDKHSSIPPPY